MDVSELTVKLAAAASSKYTLGCPLKPEPVVATVVPPEVLPDVRLNAIALRLHA